MKNLFFLIILISVMFSCKTTKVATGLQPLTQETSNVTAVTDYSLASTWLLGYFDQDRLRETPHSEWFLNGFRDYSYNENVVQKLREIKTDNLSITIVMGTWCPDSRREVPRFMRILDSWDFPASKLKFIGVDNSKLAPVGEYENLDILRVPTFIIYLNNIEAGRIIENPTTSLEQDMVNILIKNEL